ncbi:Transcription factor BOA15 [Colletotrichum sp. SAR11_239]|nr:Transcription factor BOA15 [Colletotrichum sp. SAR11_239]
MSTLFLTPRDRYPSDSKAPQACGSCKRQKRKCDKALPACGLCTRMERRCDYVESAQAAPTADDFAALQQRLAELEGRINENGGGASGGAGGVASSSGPSPVSDPSASGLSINNDSPAYPAVEPLWEQQTASQFPPDVFLDMATYEWLNQPVPKPFIEVPAEVLQHLGDGTSVQSSIATYFTTIHPWLPIVSKKRMNMGVALSQGGPDLAMLFLAMKLMTTRPEPESNMPAARMPLYRVAKRFMSLLENGGATSLMALQSMLLIAHFEYAHGIYPAAWITAGSCVRYADFLGLPTFQEGNLLLSSPTTWTELEERKRTWWAILILDRFICIGNKKRYLSPDPADNETLPADDEAWDQGRVDRAVHHTISSPAPSPPTSPFPTLCRCALLTAKVLTHVRSREPPIPDAASLSEALTTALASLPSDLPYLAPRCVLLSSAILLYDFYCCPATPTGRIRTPDETTQQIRAVEGIRRLSGDIADLARELLLLAASIEDGKKGDSTDIGVISPLILDALYGAANTLAWLVREEGSAECEEAVAVIKQCLVKLGDRWRLAREYLRMLEEQAFAYTMQDQGHSTIRIR